MVTNVRDVSFLLQASFEVIGPTAQSVFQECLPDLLKTSHSRYSSLQGYERTEVDLRRQFGMKCLHFWYQESQNLHA